MSAIITIRGRLGRLRLWGSPRPQAMTREVRLLRESATLVRKMRSE